MEMEIQNKVESWTENFTNEEKLLLIQMLKHYKPRKASELPDHRSGSTEEEIKASMEFFKRSSNSSPIPETEQKHHINELSPAILAGWAKFVDQSHVLKDLQSDIAIGLYLMGNFQSRPPPASTSNINYRKVFGMLVRATKIKIMQHDSAIRRHFKECVTECEA